jgi:HKD family nuclease
MQSAFIINQPNKNHLSDIQKLILESDEIYIATAFLKQSGLKLIFPALKTAVSNNAIIKIIAGQHFGLTDPEALRTLHNLFNGKLNAHLFLDNAKVNSVFHPKLYLFKKKNTVTIICGSANLTKGGITDNSEASLRIRLKANAELWLDTKTYVLNLMQTENADLVNFIIINRYEQYYNAQKKLRSGQRATPEKKSYEFPFDLSKLKTKLNLHKDQAFIEMMKERKKDYREAKSLLDEVADTTRLKQERFEEIIEALVGSKGYSRYWYSGSLFRHKTSVYEYKKAFQDMVSYIRDNKNKRASEVFEHAKQMVSEIKGAGINYVTEIMMTYQPKEFANLNSNPIKVLKSEAGVHIKASSQSFNGNDYELYCQIVKDINQELGLENMMEADSFFNEIYWKLKKEDANS